MPDVLTGHEHAQAHHQQQNQRGEGQRQTVLQRVTPGPAQGGPAAFANGCCAWRERGLQLEQSTPRTFAEDSFRSINRLILGERRNHFRVGLTTSMPAIRQPPERAPCWQRHLAFDIGRWRRLRYPEAARIGR